MRCARELQTTKRLTACFKNYVSSLRGKSDEHKVFSFSVLYKTPLQLQPLLAQNFDVHCYVKKQVSLEFLNTKSHKRLTKRHLHRYAPRIHSTHISTPLFVVFTTFILQNRVFKPFHPFLANFLRTCKRYKNA